MVERPGATTVDKLVDVVVTCEVIVESSVIVTLAPAPRPTCSPAAVSVCVVVEIDEMVCVTVEMMETV
jgi:hypothetical protein